MTARASSMPTDATRVTVVSACCAEVRNIAAGRGAQADERLVERRRASRARSPCMSTSTSARRTRSGGGGAGRCQLARAACRDSSGVSPSSTAARTDAAHRPSPLPSSSVEGLAQLLRAERLGLEERELPAVERLAELRILVGERAAGRRCPRRARPRNSSSRVGSPCGCVAAIGSTGRMPYGRQSRRSKSTGPAATGAAVASRSAVTASASSPGASGGSGSPLRRLALELDHAEAVGLAAEVRRQQPMRLGPVRGELARGGVADAQSAAELDRAPPTEMPTSGATAAYGMTVRRRATRSSSA